MPTIDFVIILELLQMEIKNKQNIKGPKDKLPIVVVAEAKLNNNRSILF